MLRPITLLCKIFKFMSINVLCIIASNFACFVCTPGVHNNNFIDDIGNISNDIRGAADFGKDLRDITSPGKMGREGLKKAADSIDKWAPEEGAEPKTETERLARERAAAVRERAEAARASVAARNPLPGSGPAADTPTPASGSEATEQ